MRNITKLIICTALTGFLTSCSNGYIDPISEMAPGEDVSAPVVKINSPAPGNTTIPYPDTVTNQKFDFSVSDDIEIGSVEILVDGIKKATYSSFLDYRNFSGKYEQDLGLGDHTFTVNATDKSGKSSTQTVSFSIDNQYIALFGEKFYVPFFAGSGFTDLLSGGNPAVVGSPTTVSNGYSGFAYKGATNSYLVYPLSGLYSNDKGISFTFWYKVDASPDRGGIITINDNDNNSDENRNQGLRLFREGNATAQRIKLNVGTGSGESWNDGAEISVAAGEWVHIAVTVSPTESKIYFNGVLKNTASYSAFDFSTSTNMVVGSGAPSFTYWNHLSDLSLLDELRVYDKALNEDEVKATMQ